MLQETIVSSYQNFSSLKHEQAFLSFLFTIASRKQQLARSKNGKTLSIDESDYGYLADKSASPEVLADIHFLYEAMAKLPQEQKEAIILFDIMGFSRKEVCDIQNVNLEALKARLYRGRKKLAELLGAEDDSEDFNSYETLSVKGSQI